MFASDSTLTDERRDGARRTRLGRGVPSRRRNSRFAQRSNVDVGRKGSGGGRRRARAQPSDTLSHDPAVSRRGKRFGALAHPERTGPLQAHGECLQRQGEHSVRRREDQAARRRPSDILVFAANTRLKPFLVSPFPAAKVQNRLSRTVSYNVTQDVRDLTYWKVEDWDAGYEILRHSDDGDLAERYEAGQHRVPEHT
jgi:hypothetical protein